MKLDSINPSNNTILGEVQITTEAELQSMVKTAHLAKENWKELGVEGRNKILRHFYDVLEKHADDIAKLQAEEMGMPISEAKEDVDSGLTYLRWYSDHANESLAPEISFEDEHELHTVYREPRGVVGVIIPWNFPFSNFVWQCGQNLVAGNVVLLKHSEEVPLFSKKLEALAVEAKLPSGVLSFVYGDGKIGNLLAHQNLDMICFTGSTKVGKHLYKVAAEKFIPALMELGGSAPGIVFEDANLPEVIETIVINRFINCGQVCDGLKRLLVHQSRHDELLKLLAEKISAKKIGDALDKDVGLGPLVAERQVVALEAQVKDAKNKGANIAIGGKRPSDIKGAYYEPTL